MSTQDRVVQTGALPPNTTKPLPPGASNIYTAGMITQQNQAQQQATLAQNGGIRKKRKSRYIKGGATGVASSAAPAVVVAPAPSYSPDPAATNANNTDIAKLANDAANGAAFDNTTSQSQVAGIAAQQQAVYNGTGGKKWSSSRKLGKKGGSWPNWGCLSGGKKSRRYKKNCKCKSRKHRKTKRHRRTRK